MSMEFRMTTDLATALPSEIVFNFDELKKELAERLEHYNALVVTEDTIKEAKTDRASLNKLRDAIETRRKEVKKQVLEPYNVFESRVKELTGLIDQPIQAIDTQLATHEEKRKEEKRKEIEAVYAGTISDTIKDIIPLDRILDKKWLNATTTMKKVEEEITAWGKRVFADLLALDTVEPEYKAAIRETYIRTLDIEQAMAHRKSLKAAAEAFAAREAQQAARAEKPAEKPVEPVSAPVEPTAEEKRYMLRLEFCLTKGQANALKQFLANNNIDYKKI